MHASSSFYKKLETTLLNTIPSSVLLVDKNRTVVLANRNFLEKSRRTQRETIGHRIEEVFPPIIVENTDILKRVNDVLEKEVGFSGEKMTYRAPGIQNRIYYYSILPFVWDEHVKYALIMMEDVTEQERMRVEVRKTEHHLASVVESANEIVISTDKGWNILTWNTAAEKFSGFGRTDVIGRNFFKFCHAGSREEADRILSDLVDSKAPRMAEWGLEKCRGGQVPVSWVFSPMRDENGQTVGIVMVGRDLIERDKLFQSQKLAALGIMAGGIAHELRNPLAICYSAAQFLMSEDIEPGFRADCLGKMLKAIERSSTIIEKLLRFSRNSPASEHVPIDITCILGEALSLVSNQAKIQKIKVKTCFPKDKILIKGDGSLLQQAFLNLYLNGINALPNGGTLETSVEKSENKVTVRIKDDGVGIPEEELGSIFDPFYTTSPVGKGTGLGLSITYSILQQHSGAIEVESAKGEGSTFTVRLPVT